MYSAQKSLQSRFTLPSLRSTTKERPLSEADTESTNFVVSPSRLSFTDDDLVDLDPAEFAEEGVNTLFTKSFPFGGAERRPSKLYPATHTLRRLSVRISKHIPRPTSLHTTSEQRQRRFSAPSGNDTQSPSGPSSDPTSWPRTESHPFSSLTERIATIIADTRGQLPIPYDSDPFRGPETGHTTSFVPVIRLQQLDEQGQPQTTDPNSIRPSPPNSSIPTPVSIRPSSAISSADKPFRKSLRRLKTLTRGTLFQSHPRGPTDKSSGGESTETAPSAVAAPAPAPHLPELSFDPTPLSNLLAQDYTPTPDTAVAYPERQAENYQATTPALPRVEVVHEADATAAAAPGVVPLIKWQRVDPKDLTPSPYTTVSVDLALPEPPSLAPSPSWLSRNVREFEQLYFNSRLSTSQVITDSPAPLPILPRSLLPVDTRPPSIAEPGPFRLVIDPPSSPPRSPDSQSSSLTLCSPETPLDPALQSHSPSINRLSILHYNLTPDRRSVHSVITVSFSGPEEDSSASTKNESARPRLLLLLHPAQTPTGQSLEVRPSPLALSLPVSFGAGLSRVASSAPQTPVDPYEVYLPPPSALDESDDTFPLPEFLRAVANSIVQSTRTTPKMPADAFDKPAETVDWGEEVDYSGYEWFKDPPPPRPEPAPQPPVGETYMPHPGVIEQNEMFTYALKCAPNVLYGRYKQYGQLGVLGWCAEFGEMIDAVKVLGIDGNMFVSTRTQALRTCEEILKLNLDIEMQIIVMYLSSQVARLRRFLDSGKQFDDYPQPKFPIDPLQYSE